MQNKLQVIDVTFLTNPLCQKLSEIEKEAFGTSSNNKEDFYTPYTTTLIAKIDKNTVGYLTYSHLNNFVYIANMAVSSAYRKKGIAKLLLSSLYQLYSEIYLDVKSINTSAIKLYTSEGFKILHERKHFYKDGNSSYFMSRKVIEPLQNT